jgi:tRNA (guanine26-N2/guanine27-N2)-dimethyltransferase
MYSQRRELPDVPLFYTLPGLMSLVKAPEIKLKLFKAQIRQLGYRVSHSHREATAIKTDCPIEKLFDIVRAWAKLKDAKPKDDKGVKIMSKGISPEVIAVIDFSNCEDHEDDERPVAMFLPNPESNWGPKKAAGNCVKKQKLNNE